MKRFVLFIVLMALCVSGWSQTQSLNFEIFGSSGMAGVNYDARFKDNYGFGFSVGIGYGYANRSYDFLETRGNDGVTHFIGAPVEINYLFGKRASHFVLGAGAMAGVAVNEGGPTINFGYNVFCDIAYRYQKPSGFAFSVGLKPNMNKAFWPYMCLGWSF